MPGPCARRGSCHLGHDGEAVAATPVDIGNVVEREMRHR